MRHDRRHRSRGVAAAVLLVGLAAACSDNADGDAASVTTAPSTSVPALDPESLPTLPAVEDVVAAISTTEPQETGSFVFESPVTPVPVEDVVAATSTREPQETGSFVFESPVTPVPIEAVSSVTIGEPEVFDIDLSRVRQPSVSPTGRLAYTLAEDLCIVEPGAEPFETCWDLGRTLSDTSLVWSPDEQTIVGTTDLRRREPTVSVVRFDIATGTADAIGGEGPSFGDVGPFFDDSGILYFFRILPLDDGPGSQLHRVEDDVAVPIGSVNAFIARVPVVSDGAFVVAPSGRPDQGLGLFDLAAPDSIAVADNPPDAFTYRAPIAVEDGRALVVSRDDQTDRIRAGLLDLRSGTGASLNPLLDDRQQLTGVGLDPTGTRVAAIVEDRSDPFGHRLLVGEIGADGAVNSFSVVATGEDFAPNGGDPTIRPRGFGDLKEISWGNGQLTYAVGPLQIVRLPID